MIEIKSEWGKMRQNRVVFALFAAAMLFAMVREWNAPIACVRPVVVRGTTLLRAGR